MRLMRPWISILLGGLFCLRYLSFESAPFNGDEASLQIAARHAWETGVVPWLGLAGTAGVRYGPTGIWFYALVRGISSSLEFAFFVHATLHGLGFLLQGIAFQRILKRDILVPFLVIAWSAPLFWIGSRNVWDNSLQVFLFGLLGILLTPGQARMPYGRALLSGIIVALLVNLHLMTVPITAAWIAWAWRRGELRPRGLLILGAAALVLIVPYVFAALSVPRPETSEPKAWFHLFHRAFIFPILLPGLVLPGRVAYFFDQPWETWAGPAARLWSDVGLSGLLQLVGLGIGVFGVVKLPKHARGFVLAHFVVYGAFVSALRLNFQIHPHYLTPVFGLAALIWALGWTEVARVRKRLAYIGMGLLLAINLSAILKIEITVRAESGFRGPHWGASLDELKRVASEYCGRPDLREAYSPKFVALDPRLGFDPRFALEFLRSEHAGCAQSGVPTPLPVSLRLPESPFSAALALPSAPDSK